jgi:PAS domain S-box-containing protein
MLLEELVNNLPSMVGYWDNNLLNVYSNNAYKIFFNKSPESIVGKHIRDVIGDDLFFKNKPYIERALKGEHTLFERDISLPDGSVRSTQAEYIPVKSKNGSVEGFYVLVTDISPVKKVEKEKEELYQKLVQNSKMVVLGEMAGGIAHEINNPLSIIDVNVSLLSEMLKTNNLDLGRMEKVVAMLENTTRRISKIVNGLLHFSRERSDDPYVLSRFKDILEETMTFCAEKIKKRKIDFIVEPYNEDLLIECAPVQISQVLLNLISNAADAITDLPEKKIVVSLKEGAHFIEILIMDSGHGIDPVIADKMMQPFFTTKETGAGTGLGLSISKGIVEKHKGFIGLDRNAKNTTFVISLPKVQGKY